MENRILSYLIIILLSIAIGMWIGLITKPSNQYQGPNAKTESKKLYLNNKTGQCIRFAIKPLTCSKTNWRKFLDYATNIY